MIKKIMLFIFVICFTSCTSVKYITIPLSEPPEPYKIEMGQIRTQKDLFKEYQKTLKKINEWEAWYSIQTNIDKKK